MILCNLLTCDKCILWKWKIGYNGISYSSGYGYCSAKDMIKEGE